MGAEQVYIRLLGAVSVRFGEQECDRFRTRKTAALLAYLATRIGKPETRDALLDLLWPESDLDAARNSLRVALSSLRQMGDLPLIVERDTVCLSAERVAVDALQFERTAREALSAEAADALDRLIQARELYAGPFLPGYDGEWITAERGRLAELHASVLRKLSRALARAERFSEALETARLSVEATPYHEGAHRTLIRLLVKMGHSYEARQVYRLLVKRLQDELKATPAKETLELWHQIRTPPAPASEPAPRLESNVPQTLTRFFGREREMEEVGALLDDPGVRLITLTGVGGSGKTRLALQVLSNRSEPRHFVSCVHLSDADALPLTIAASVGARREEGRDILEAITGRLGPAPFQLVLDNLEGLLDSRRASAWLLRLLEQLPRLKVLVTSRIPLEAPGEVRYPVGPLPTPDTAAGTEIGESPSVRLFLDRAQHRRPSFRLTPENTEAVRSVCRRLDGMPLALELAATWINALSLSEMSEELGRRLDILSTSDASFAERHRSLRQVIQASYEMLPGRAQSLFRRVSLLAGGFSRDLARALFPSADPWAATEDLALLTERALVVEAGSSEAAFRFRVLDPLREFAAEVTSGEERDEGLRHATDYLIRLVEESAANLEGEHSVESLSAIDREHANIGAALDWCEKNDIGRGLRLMGALARPWEVLTHFVEGRGRCERFLTKVPREADSIAVARVHYCAALMCHGLGDPPAVEAHFGEAERRLRDAGEWLLVCDILRRRIELLGFHQRLEEANAVAEECIRLAESHGFMKQLAFGLGIRADILRDFGNHEEAGRLYAEAIEILEKEEDLLGICTLTASYGFHLTERQDLVAAKPLLERSLELARRLHYRAGVAHRYWLLGNLAWKAGRLDESGDLFADSLEMHRRDGDRRGMTYAMGNLAVARVVQGQPEEAAELLHERLQLVEAMGDFPGVGQTLLFLARAYWRSGALELAERTYRRTVEFSRTHTHHSRMSEALSEIALLYLAQRDDEAAWECIEEIPQWLPEGAPWNPQAEFAQAVLESRRGRPERLRRLVLNPDELGVSQEVRWMIEPFGFGLTLSVNAVAF